MATKAPPLPPDTASISPGYMGRFYDPDLVMHPPAGSEPDTEDEPALTAAASAPDTNTGAMIALVPTGEDLNRLALDGGEPPAELHLTLVYLGEAADISPDMAAEIMDAAEHIQDGPVEAKVFGAALWNPGSDNPSWVLNVGDNPDRPN